MGANGGIVTFEHPTLGDAASELRALGADYVTDLVLYLNRLCKREINHRALGLFCVYRGVECMLYQPDWRLAVFAVEEDHDHDLKITILFAGLRGHRVQGNFWVWDGFDFQMLRTQVILPRATAWFL